MGTDSVRRGLARIAIALVVGFAAFVYYTVLTLPPPQEEWCATLRGRGTENALKG